MSKKIVCPICKKEVSIKDSELTLEKLTIMRITGDWRLELSCGHYWNVIHGDKIKKWMKIVVTSQIACSLGLITIGVYVLLFSIPLSPLLGFTILTIVGLVGLMKAIERWRK